VGWAPAYLKFCHTSMVTSRSATGKCGSGKKLSSAGKRVLRDVTNRRTGSIASKPLKHGYGVDAAGVMPQVFLK
jgi:hypothetical protein